ncbi:hypothetical protein [Wolbachia endosymbiont of Dactylopius coccus]
MANVQILNKNSSAPFLVIPVLDTGMTPFVVNSLLPYGLAAILNGYNILMAILKPFSSFHEKTLLSH